jgi:hypothetical protein
MPGFPGSDFSFYDEGYYSALPASLIYEIVPVNGIRDLQATAEMWIRGAD